MFDRRTGRSGLVDAYLFDALFADGTTIEVQVNSEFGNRHAAAEQALLYATIVGKTPAFMRTRLEQLSIHKGDFLPGGASGNIVLHVDRLEEDRRGGNLEELIIHEAAHASLDEDHARNPAWKRAQEEDDDFISSYAHDYPEREDVAESILMYLAITYLPGRLGSDKEEWVRRTIPNRIRYFDNQSFEGLLCPIVLGDCPAEFRAEFE